MATRDSFLRSTRYLLNFGHVCPSKCTVLKALCALFEKEIPFKEHIVHIDFGGQHEDWYLCLNPEGKVPVLQDGDKVIIESEEIINYIDKEFPTEPGLADLKLAFKEMTDGASSEEKKSYLEKKLRELEKRYSLTSSLSQVSKLMDEQESLFDELEDQLKRMKKECSSDDYWLCGRTFTAADVIALTLVLRFYMLGIDGRYINPERPLLCDYRERLMERQSAMKIKDILV